MKTNEILLIIPVTTNSVERSFSTMIKVLTETRKKLLSENFIGIEMPDIPTEDFWNKIAEKIA